MRFDTAHLDSGAYPENEKRVIRSIQLNLHRLDSYLKDFAAALALFDHAEMWLDGQETLQQKDLVSDWMMIAARDGAMTIYHFGAVIDGIRVSLKDCPTFRDSLDYPAFRVAAKRLAKEFPFYTNMRHAIGHRGELAATIDDYDKNAVNGPIQLPGIQVAPDAKNTFIHILNGRTLVHSFAGQIITYDLSAESLQKLENVREELMPVFRDAEPPAGS